MKDTKTLKYAYKVRNDEFYTYLEDIEAELQHYDFEDKIVYCNCDHPIQSNFVKYFCDNYHELKLRGFISTFYSEEGKSFVYRFDGLKESKIGLCGDGSYDSEECLKYLEECDVVVTNPPFSKFKEFVPYLMQHNKKFIILGNLNVVGYQCIFPYIQNQQMWLGINQTSGTRKGNTLWFYTPDGDRKPVSAFWYTNYGTPTYFPLEPTETYSPEKYPYLDNYDAIEVSRFKKIPKDFEGWMAVPITAIKHWDPNQYILGGLACRNNTFLRTKYYNLKDYDGAPCLMIEGKLKPLFVRLLIKRK